MDRFRFVTEPFTRELKVDQRFKVDFIENEIKKLKEIVDARQSAAIVGPAGSGKTVIVRALTTSLPEARYRVIYLKLASLGARDMCRQVALGLGLPPIGSFPSLVRALEERLRSGYQEQGMRQLLIFDDAHEMRPDTLKLIRLLTNFDMDSKLVVSVLLAGQCHLKKILMAPEMEDVRHRLNYCGELRLLGRDETRAYIAHRVSIAGAPKSPFAADAQEALFEITVGNMRAIDKLAGGSLKTTDEAGRSVVSASEVAATRAKQWM
jgi:type II secretory pathway predicted ATPase ExeA